MDASHAVDAIDIVDAADRDRIALGYELHDGILQRLSAAKMHLEYAAAKMLENGIVVFEPVEKALEQLTDVLREGRELVASLTDSHTILLTGSPDNWPVLRDRLVQRITAQSPSTDIRCIESNQPWPTLEKGVVAQVLRIVEQALLNSIQHSGASRLQVEQGWAESSVDTLVLRISDNGIGFYHHDNGSQGHGLASMRFRASLIGGKLEIKSQPSEGTVVELRFRA